MPKCDFVVPRGFEPLTCRTKICRSTTELRNNLLLQPIIKIYMFTLCLLQINKVFSTKLNQYYNKIFY